MSEFVQLASSVLAEREAMECLESTAQNDRWMMVAWAVVDGKVQLIRRVCWNFPTGDMMEALSLLAHNFFEESRTGNQLPNTPLPRAKLPLRSVMRGVLYDDDELLPITRGEQLEKSDEEVLDGN
jgi:hypothetical protein